MLAGENNLPFLFLIEETIGLSCAPITNAKRETNEEDLKESMFLIELFDETRLKTNETRREQMSCFVMINPWEFISEFVRVHHVNYSFEEMLVNSALVSAIVRFK